MRLLRRVSDAFVCLPIGNSAVRHGCVALAIVSFALLSRGAWAQGCTSSGPYNTPPYCAYITDGSGHDVLAVDRSTTPATISTVVSLKPNQGNTIDVRLGADNRLYFLTSSAVLRVNLDGTGLQTVSALAGLTGIRFDQAGDAFVNTAGGVWEFPALIYAAGTKASPFPKAMQVTSSSCSTSGGLAFDAFGDLLIACNSGNTGSVLECTQSQLSNLPCTPSNPVNSTLPIKGLAVDALGDVLYASGTSVYATCTSGCATPFDSVPLPSGNVPAYIETVPNPQGTFEPNPVSSPPCNSATPSILVSTASSSGTNGAVYSIDDIPPVTAPKPPVCTFTGPTVTRRATLSKTSLPAVGMASSATLTTLTKPATANASGSYSFTFNYGTQTLYLTPATTPASTPPAAPDCNLSMTKVQVPVAYISSRLAAAGYSASAIGYDGEQGWVTGFHGNYVDPNSCNIDPAARSAIGIGGFAPYVNPHIAIIPDAGGAVVDELPFIYPIAPLQGNPGDFVIHNTTAPGVFTQYPATIVVVNLAFTNNAPTNGYYFCGFLSPFTDPATGKKNTNTVNSGQSATFKFQLGTNKSCSSLVSDSIAEGITTGFSVAAWGDSGGNPFTHQIIEQNGDGKGNSVAPPTFKYDATGHQFIYTLDTTGYCNGTYEATANGDIFQPHELNFTIVGSSTNCSTLVQ